MRLAGPQLREHSLLITLAPPLCKCQGYASTPGREGQLRYLQGGDKSITQGHHAYFVTISFIQISSLNRTHAPERALV